MCIRARNYCTVVIVSAVIATLSLSQDPSLFQPPSPAVGLGISPPCSDYEYQSDDAVEVAVDHAPWTRNLPVVRDMTQALEALKLNFYAFLAVATTANNKCITKAYEEKSEYYMPLVNTEDTSIMFEYTNRVFKILTKSRHEYDAEGADDMTKEFRRRCLEAQYISTVKSPGINIEFITRLMQKKFVYTMKIGDGTLAEAFTDLLNLRKKTDRDEYHETELAIAYGTQLRLVGGSPRRPVYTYPRVVRWAALMGMGVDELDLPSAHGKVILRLALKFSIPCEALLHAFDTAAAVKAFRNHPQFLAFGLQPEAVKLGVNMMTFGSKLSAWKLDHDMPKLPPLMQSLLEEIQNVMQYLMKTGSPSDEELLKNHRMKAGKSVDDWGRTLLSLHCQMGERWALNEAEKLTEHLNFSSRGYLGDSLLLPSGAIKPVMHLLTLRGIEFDIKHLPKNEAEYFEMVEKIKGPVSRDPATPRQLMRFGYFLDCRSWLVTNVIKKEGPPDVRPDLKFAVCVEEEIPVHLNQVTGKLEIYDPDNGTWFVTSSSSNGNGEVLSRKLLRVFTPRRFSLVQDERHTFKLRLKSTRSPMLENYFCNLGQNAAIASFLPKLDRDFVCDLGKHPKVDLHFNLRGHLMLDFSIAPPEFEWDSDSAVDSALDSPVRPSRIEDRAIRTAPITYKKYMSPDRFAMARAIKDACTNLMTSDVLDDDVKARLTSSMANSFLMKEIIYDAHDDWDTAFFTFRLFFDPIFSGARRVQVASLMDDGSGSTGKGTFRECSDKYLGMNTGDANIGYASQIRQGLFDISSGDPPSEQLANMQGCKHVWMDDFDHHRMINNAALRELTGGNTITAARKHKQHDAFQFRGQIFTLANGHMKFQYPLVGADSRRLAGAKYDITFVDSPDGPNQKKKDANVKESIMKHSDEFLFLARALWLSPSPRPKCDTTEPKPPNALEMLKESALVSGQVLEVVNVGDQTAAFIRDHLDVYNKTSLAKPSSADEIDQGFVCFVLSLYEKDSKQDLVSKPEARVCLSKVLKYKSGASLPGYLSRKRTTVNGYVSAVDGTFFTLASKPRTPATA